MPQLQVPTTRSRATEVKTSDREFSFYTGVLGNFISRAKIWSIFMLGN